MSVFVSHSNNCFQLLQAITLVEEARNASTHPHNADNQQRLAQVARDVSQSLNKVVGCLPGQKDVDEAIQSINKSVQVSFPVVRLTVYHFILLFLFYQTDSRKRAVPAKRQIVSRAADHAG